MFLMTGVLFHILLCAHMFLIFSEHFNLNLPCINKLHISDDVE